MEPKRTKKISKFLSLILRHKPETIGLKLDENGWAKVKEILKSSQIDWKLQELQYVVDNNDKKRFELTTKGHELYIRACQGHSVQIDLELDEATPPNELYHGTVSKSLDSIMSDGLKKMNRQHVHLSADLETATKVGGRRGKAIILVVDSKKMYENDYKFYLSKNGVWLTDSVPSSYIRIK